MTNSNYDLFVNERFSKIIILFQDFFFFWWIYVIKQWSHFTRYFKCTLNHKIAIILTIIEYFLDFLVAISILLLIFIGLFVGGILRQRKNWMVPLISSMIFSCIGLFGTLITMMSITTDSINKGFVKYPTEEIFIVANVAIFRYLLLFLFANLFLRC